MTELNNTQCRLTGDGTLCVNPKCHYREYSVGFAFEGALIFLCAPSALACWLAAFDRSIRPTNGPHVNDIFACRGVVEAQMFIICFHCE